VATTPGRPYHHGNLRQALIEAGLELARRGGPEAVVVREASRRVGVSHNAAYRHFPDRESLLAAVAEQAMVQLADLMRTLIERSAQGASSPLAGARARLRATGRAYVEFALSEPGLFRTAFSAAAHAPVPAPEDEPRAMLGAFSLLARALDELDAAGGIAAGRRPYAEHAAWSAVHGFSTLALDGPLRAMPQDERERALERVFEVIQDGLAGAGS
jgi:AcrR family transcriptional regulator